MPYVMARPRMPSPTTTFDITEPDANATDSPCDRLRAARTAVRELDCVAIAMPTKPLSADKPAPKR
jgi:hypothetical protein